MHNWKTRVRELGQLIDEIAKLTVKVTLLAGKLTLLCAAVYGFCRFLGL